MSARSIALVVSASLLGTGCFVGRHGGFGRHGGLGLLEAALVTAVIISAVAPPPPRVVFVPAPREGYVWQPGYWTRDGDDWAWVDGSWVAQRPNYQWQPSHWEQEQDGSWHLIPSQWVAVQ